jgi:hypothetical protein
MVVFHVGERTVSGKMFDKMPSNSVVIYVSSKKYFTRFSLTLLD